MKQLEGDERTPLSALRRVTRAAPVVGVDHEAVRIPAPSQRSPPAQVHTLSPLRCGTCAPQAPLHLHDACATALGYRVLPDVT